MNALEEIFSGKKRAERLAELLAQILKGKKAI